MADAAIVFRGAGYQIGDRVILQDLNLEIPLGQIQVLVGRSGSGKTTALKLVNRLLEPSSGQILVAGRETTRWDPIQLRRHIGYVIQEVGLFPHMTVERNVGLVPFLEKWDPDQVRNRVRELLDLVGLNPSDFLRRYPHQLSGGQRQRVGVARALAADPPVLLMDEPFGALDPMTRLELQEEFRALQKNLNKTVLLVTHDLMEALSLGGRIGLLESGRLVFLGPPGELLRSSDQSVAAFLAPLKNGLSRWDSELMG